MLESKNVKPADYDSAGKTTDEMKQQKTYSGFDFEKKWSISADENDGYPYYNPKTETITLEVQAKVEPKYGIQMLQGILTDLKIPQKIIIFHIV